MSVNVYYLPVISKWFNLTYNKRSSFLTKVSQFQIALEFGFHRRRKTNSTFLVSSGLPFFVEPAQDETPSKKQRLRV